MVGLIYLKIELRSLPKAHRYTRMAKKQTYHHGDLRQALLTAALTILEKKDARSLSLREVARTAGVSHTAPYRHFEDKAALLAAIAQEGFIEFGRYLTAALTPDDPVKSLQDIGVAYVRYALDHPTHFRVMFSSFPPDIPTDSELYCVSKSTFQILVDVIQSGQQAGVMKAGDPDFLALERWSMVHGLSMLLLDRMLPQQGQASIDLAGALLQESVGSIVVKR